MNASAPKPFREPAFGRLSIGLVRADEFGAELSIRIIGANDASVGATGLVGTLRGPVCLRATTLPVTVPILPTPPSSGDRGAGGRVVLTEPAYWSPELPNLYQLESRPAGAEGESSFGGTIGLRRLSASGRSFRLEGRRFVLRGITADAVSELEIVRSSFAAVATEADRLMLDDRRTLLEADRRGVFLVVRFTGDEHDSVPRSLERHPSAAFWIVRDAEAARRLSRYRVPHGPLVGLEVEGREPPPKRPTDVDFLVVHLEAEAMPHPAWLDAAPAMPLVAARRPPSGIEPRAACDLLQASLAGWAAARSRGSPPWDWAGYVPT